MKFSWSHISAGTTSCHRSCDLMADREEPEVKGHGLKRKTDLVPVAVMLRGMAVILEDLRNGALVDALQTQLPLAQF